MGSRNVKSSHREFAYMSGSQNHEIHIQNILMYGIAVLMSVFICLLSVNAALAWLTDTDWIISDIVLGEIKGQSYAAIYADTGSSNYKLIVGHGEPETQGLVETFYDIENSEYSKDDIPWKLYSSNITEIVIEEGVTPVSSAYWFSDTPRLEDITIPSSFIFTKHEDPYILENPDPFVQDEADGYWYVEGTPFDAFGIADLVSSRFNTGTKPIRLCSFGAPYAAIYGSTILVFGRGVPKATYADMPLNKDAIYRDFTDTLPDTWLASYKNSLKEVASSATHKIFPSSMKNWFLSCSALKKCDLSSIDISGVCDMSSAFDGCVSLQTLDTSDWNIKSCHSFYRTFYGCRSLEKLDMSSWPCVNYDYEYNTNNQNGFVAYMFYDCINIKELNFTWMQLCRPSENCVNGYEKVHANGFITGCTNLDEVIIPTSCFYNTAIQASCPSTPLPNRHGYVNSTYWYIGKDKEPHSVYEAFDFVNDKFASNKKSAFSSTEVVHLKTYRDFLDDDPFIAIYGGTNLVCGAGGASKIDESIFTEEGVKQLSAVYREVEKVCTNGNIAWHTNWATKIKTVDINTSLEPRDFKKWFSGHTAMAAFNFNNGSVIKPTTFEGVFENCSHLDNIDCSKFDLSNVFNFSNAFYNCGSLRSIDFGSCEIKNTENDAISFKGVMTLCSEMRSVSLPRIANNANIDYSVNYTKYTVANRVPQTDIEFIYIPAGYKFSNAYSVYDFGTPSYNRGGVVNSIYWYMDGDGSPYNNKELHDYYEDYSESDIKWVSNKADHHDEVYLAIYTFDSNATISDWMLTKDKMYVYGVGEPDENLGSLDFVSSSNSPCFRGVFYEIERADFVGIRECMTLVANRGNVVHSSSSEAKLLWYRNKISLSSPLRKQLPMGFDHIENFDYLDVSRIEDFSYGFQNYYDSEISNDIKSFDLHAWNTSSAKDMSYMFSGRIKLINLNLSGWDTSNVTNMEAMFKDCSSLLLNDLETLDVSNVCDMSSMFESCSSLKELDINNWRAISCTNMSSMFKNCTALENIYLENLICPSRTISNDCFVSMFENCSALTCIDMNNWNFDNAFLRYETQNKPWNYCGPFAFMFRNCSNIESIDLSRFISPNWGNTRGTNCMFDQCTKLIKITIPSTFMFDRVNENSYLSYQTSTFPQPSSKTLSFEKQIITNEKWYIDHQGEAFWITNNLNDNNPGAYIYKRYGSGKAPVTFYCWRDVLENDAYAATYSNNNNQILVFARTSTSSIPENYEGLSLLNYCLNIESQDQTGVDHWNSINDPHLYTSVICLDEIFTYDMHNWFRDYSLCTSFDLERINTSHCLYFYGMFSGCTSIDSIDLSSWDTSCVKEFSKPTGNINGMFSESAFANSMFYNCSSLRSLKLCGWNFSSRSYVDQLRGIYTDQAATFISNCPSLQEIDFSNCSYKQAVYPWINCDSLTKVIIPKDMSVGSLGIDASSTQIVEGIHHDGHWYREDQKAMKGLNSSEFASYLNSEQREGNTVWVAGNKQAYAARYLNENNGSRILTFGRGFYPEEIDGYILEEVWDDIEEKSYAAYLGIYSAWGSSSEIQTIVSVNNRLFDYQDKIKPGANTMSSYFCDLYNATNIYADCFNVVDVTNMDGLFRGCRSLINIEGLNDWDVGKVTSMSQMFWDCHSIQSFDAIERWNVQRLTNSSGMFEGCSSVNTFDFSKWRVPLLESIYQMFENCNALESIALPSGSGYTSFVNDRVQSLNSLFASCYALKSLDVSNWDLSNVEEMNSTFYKCMSLQTLNAQNWQTSKVKYMAATFSQCYSLSLDCSKWNVSNVQVTSSPNYGYFSSDAPGVIDPIWNEISTVEGNSFEDLSIENLDSNKEESLQFEQENYSDENTDEADAFEFDPDAKPLTSITEDSNNKREIITQASFKRTYPQITRFVRLVKLKRA